MRGAIVFALFSRLLTCKCMACRAMSPSDRSAALGHFFNRMAIAVTCGKIHLAVDTTGIPLQGLLNHAVRFNKLAPVHGRQEPETADAVADGDLVDGLLLGFRLNQLLDREPGFGQSLFDPGQGQGSRRRSVPESAGKFRHKCAHHRRVWTAPCPR